MKGTDKQNITVKIDGKTVGIQKGKTILEAAQKAGIYIPTLCYLKELEPYGGCRLCMVEIKDVRGYPTACTTPVTPNMEITTKTPGLQSLRKEILELTLSEHPYTCLTCKEKKECTDFMHTTRKAGTITGCNFCTSNGDCELQDLVDYLELSDVRYPISYRGIPPEKRNPFYDLDYNLCILCGRCVRICNEGRNSKVLAFVQRGQSTIVGTAFNESQADAGCEFCGACVDVCPTGSISEKMGKWAGMPNRSTVTACVLCSVGCTMNVNVRDGKVVNVGPIPGQRTDPRQLCLRGKFLPGDFSHHPSRVSTPMIRKNGKWVEVSWQEAFKFTTGRLNKLKDGRFGLLGSAQDTLEENYILQKFARVVMRSNHVDLYASYPNRELASGIHELVSVRSANGNLDIGKADTCLVLGTDASITHPLLESKIRKGFNEGRNILYANYEPTRTSTFATQEIHYAPDEEYHFLLALLAGIAREKRSLLPDGIARKFKKADVTAALALCAVPEKKLVPFIAALVRSRKLCIVVSDDYLRRDTGREVLTALGNFHFLMGKQSKCNILIPSLEGNIHAGTMVGMHPDILPRFDSVMDGKAIRRWNRNWNARLNTSRGLSLGEMLKITGREGISALLVAGDLPLVPRLKKLSFLVQLNMFHTALTEYADVFLPVAGFLESDGHIMAMDGKIKRLRRIMPVQEGARSIPAIISALAKGMEEAGFSGSRQGSIWKEMLSFDVIPTHAPAWENNNFQSMKPLPRSGPRGSASKLQDQTDYFRYRGNKLTELIPDLQSVVEGLKTEKAAYGQGT